MHVSVVLAVDILISATAMWVSSLPIHCLLRIPSNVSFQLLVAVTSGTWGRVVWWTGPVFWRNLMSPSSLEDGDQTTRCHQNTVTFGRWLDWLHEWYTMICSTVMGIFQYVLTWLILQYCMNVLVPKVPFIIFSWIPFINDSSVSTSFSALKWCRFSIQFLSLLLFSCIISVHYVL
jgi:hypothetical protein